MAEPKLVASIPVVDDLAVERAEELLAQCKSGVVQGFVVATVNAAGECGTGWGGTVYTYSMIGVLETLKMRIGLEFDTGLSGSVRKNLDDG